MTAMSSLLDQNQMQIEDLGCAKTSAKAQGASQGAATSQAKAKRKRPVRHRKKFRTVASLMQPEPAASSSESQENQDANTSVHMESSDTEDDQMSTTNYSKAKMHV